MSKQYIAISYYQFVSIDDPIDEVNKHKFFFEKRDCVGRIYISKKGINGQLSGFVADAEAYIDWLKRDGRFSKLQFKMQNVSEPIFPRMTIKYRAQLVALDQEIDVKNGALHVPPKKWKEMLESGEYLVLDVRNQYEWEIGHFEGAILPPLQNFREFPTYAEKLKETVDPSQAKIMMYCTGGIRCELYSVLLKNKGFKEIYQLEGGVINYGFEEGSSYWKGKLFVFDDRLAITIDGKNTEPIAKCLHCKKGCDTYYNCANMDCNELFICCSSCLEIYKGCCSFDCKNASRLRALNKETSNRPFRRKHLVVLPSQAPESDSESA